MENLPQLKIIIAGPEGAGKSDFIRIICPSCILDFSEGDSKLPIDLGSANRGEYTLRLTGLPGKKEFLFMIDMLVKGASGAVILINVNHIEKIPEVIKIIRNIEKKNIPFIVAFNNIKTIDKFDYENLQEKYRVNFEIIPISTFENWNVDKTIDNLIEKISKSENPIIYEDNIKL